MFYIFYTFPALYGCILTSHFLVCLFHFVPHESSDCAADDRVSLVVETDGDLVSASLFDGVLVVINGNGLVVSDGCSEDEWVELADSKLSFGFELLELFEFVSFPFFFAIVLHFFVFFDMKERIVLKFPVYRESNIDNRKISKKLIVSSVNFFGVIAPGDSQESLIE